jgi:hypothetical protein
MLSGSWCSGGVFVVFGEKGEEKGEREEDGMKSFLSVGFVTSTLLVP